jgi:uncharacterized protein
LDNGTADAKAFGIIEERFEHRQSDGAMYSIFTAKTSEVGPDFAYGTLGVKRARELTELFGRTNGTILELAATIDWLWRQEKYDDWQREISKRKGAKVRNGRLAACRTGG